VISIYKPLKSQRGISLVELLIALSILSIVLGLAYSLFFFSTKSFKMGSNQSNIQQNLRSVSSFIHKEVRHAVEIETLDTSFTPTQGYEYIFAENSSINHGKFINGSFVKTSKSDAIIVNSTGLVFTIKKLDNGSNLLEFTVRAGDEKQSYDIKSVIYLNNVQDRSNKTGSIIRYKKPQ